VQSACSALGPVGGFPARRASGRPARHLLVASAALLATLSRGSALAGIAGSVHDLSPGGPLGTSYSGKPPDAQQRICIFCHAPHNTYELSPVNGGPPAGIGAGRRASDDFTYLPLWNHTLQTNTTYQMYQNGPGAPQDPTTPNASQAIAGGMAPGGTSLLCLSCHDGSVAVNSYGDTSQLSRSQSRGTTTIRTPYRIGGDGLLANHHPIGFDFDLVQAGDPGIRPADAASFGGGEPVRSHLYGPGNRRMECGTCHAVHSTGTTGEALLWKSDQRSAFCLTCHLK